MRRGPDEMSDAVNKQLWRECWVLNNIAVVLSSGWPAVPVQSA